MDRQRHLVMLDWVSPPTARALLAMVRRRQHLASIAVMVPSWSDLEAAARLAADHVLYKPRRVSQVRRVLAQALAAAGTARSTA